MPVTRSLPQLPDPSTPVPDGNSTRMNRVWYSYLSEQRAVLSLMRIVDVYTNVFTFMTTAEVDDASGRIGAIDVTSKLQAAIDSLTAGTVVIPPGVFTFGDVTLKPGVGIVGAGRGSTIVRANANNCHIFDYVATGTVTYFDISNISFEANGFTGVRAISIDGTDETKRCVYVNIEDCNFNDMDYAVYRRFCANSFLSNLHAIGGVNGFWNDTCADSDIVNCRSQLASGNGFGIIKSSGPSDHSDEGTRLANCSTNGTAVGLFVDGANWGQVSNGSFTTCSGASCAAFVGANNWGWHGGDAASALGSAGIIADVDCTNITLNGLTIALNTIGVSFAGGECSVLNSKFAANTNADGIVSGGANVVMGNVASSAGSSTFSFVETAGDKNIFTNNVVHRPVSILGPNSISNNNVAF